MILILKISFLNTIGSIVKEKKEKPSISDGFFPSLSWPYEEGIKYLLCAFQERQSEIVCLDLVPPPQV